MTSTSSLGSSSNAVIQIIKLEEPDDDVIPYIPRKSNRFTTEQIRLLTIQYFRSRFLEDEEWAKLTAETGLTKVQIRGWFSRKRRKDEMAAERAERINNEPPPPPQLHMPPPLPPQMSLLPPTSPLINLPPPLPLRMPLLPPQTAPQQLFAAYYNLLMQTNQLQNPIAHFMPAPVLRMVPAPMPRFEQFYGFYRIPTFMPPPPNTFTPFQLPNFEVPVIKQEPLDNEN